MPGYRFDELTGSWIVVAPERRGLPLDPGFARFGAAVLVPEDSLHECPFCPGNESETEAAVDQCVDAAGNWLVRVVRNRYPSVREDATIASPAQGGEERPAVGHHEIVVESRSHELDLADFDDAQATRVLCTYRDRTRALESIHGVAAVSLFRNRGRRSGSSQSHPHAQLVATCVLPTGFAVRQARAASYAHAHAGGALLDLLVAREREAAARMVEHSERFDVFCPFASHRAFETWIVPATRHASLSACDSDELAALAPVLTRTLRRVHHATRGAAYNLLVRSAPVDDRTGFSRWHLEVVPRTGGDAGFELVSGMDVVPVAPEQSAREIRESPA